MWQQKVEHWEASPPYYPVADGKTLEEAADAAIGDGRGNTVSSGQVHPFT
jgi:hypothetical protein